MVDYSFTSEIKLVLTLHLSASSFEYYDWEDTMEDFLWDRGLESRMKIFFARHTFSASVLQWWIKLQQGLINRGKDPCRTWKGMKAILKCKFDPSIEKRVHKTTRVASAISSTNFPPTKSVMKSSWSDSIIGDQCLNNLNPGYGFVAEDRNSVTLNKKANVVAARPRYSLNHYEVKSATLFVENMKLTNVEIFTSSKHYVGASASSVATVIPSLKDHQKVLLSTTISHVEQGVQSFGVAENEPPMDDIVDNISSGLSMTAREAKFDGTIVDVNGQRSNVFQSKCNIKDKVCKLIINGSSFTNAINSDLVQSLTSSVKSSLMTLFEVGAINRPPPTPLDRCPLRETKSFFDIQSLSSLISP
jgi:hypothetical protein